MSQTPVTPSRASTGTSLTDFTGGTVVSMEDARNPSDAPPENEGSPPKDIGIVYLMAVTFKEATLDSPTFRASMNHLNEQFESLDRWIDSLTKALNKITVEMDCM
jgi:hypothetical protein